MKNEFVPYEQALALKVLGFDEPCLASFYTYSDENVYLNKYDYRGKFNINYSGEDDYIINTDKTYYISAPLYQQAFRWFRKKYNLNANVYKWQPDFAKSMGHLEWEGSVTHFTEKKVGGSEYFNTYEEAELECLKKLIEIVKNK